jgi:hypothetical protein
MFLTEMPAKLCCPELPISLDFLDCGIPGFFARRRRYPFFAVVAMMIVDVTMRLAMCAIISANSIRSAVNGNLKLYYKIDDNISVSMEPESYLTRFRLSLNQVDGAIQLFVGHGVIRPSWGCVVLNHDKL